MYRIVLCDDDQIFAKTFKEQLKIVFSKYMLDYSFAYFSSIAELETSVPTEEIDLLFLDILLGEDNGMNYARKLRKEKHLVNIIFITSSLDYAVDSYDVFPLYYLTKPLDPTRLETALLRALSSHDCTIMFPGSHKTLVLETSSILYMEIYNHTVRIHKIDGSIETASGNLNDIEKKMPPLVFSRIHRSYLINIKYVRTIRPYYVLLSDHTKLPVARNRYASIQTNLLNQLNEKNLFF